jgi:site-specific recombinase XerD
MPRPKSKVQTVRVTGPLAPCVPRFVSTLRGRGYTPLTRASQLRVMVHLSKWLQAREWGVVELTDERVDEYLAKRCAAGYSSFRTRASLAALLDALAACGAPLTQAPTRVSPAVSGTDVLLAGYARFLREERGLAASTTAAYLLRAGRFLAWCTEDGDLRAVNAATVSGAVLREAEAVSAGSVQVFVVALRWLLRYAHLAGLIEADLSAAALPVTGRRRSSLPKGISPAQARALLRSCDRRTATGRRDYAVILILLRLGLRAGEVAGLRLEDLDWRAGQITVRGKGHRIDQLPLPTDVGAAIAGYLRRGRPATAQRGVFLRSSAPRTVLTREAVSLIVRRACRRAGMNPHGAHVLRHGLACQLLRAGAPLREIGQLLRQHADTTVSLYARVDVDRLRAVARPWPSQPCGSAR